MSSFSIFSAFLFFSASFPSPIRVDTDMSLSNIFLSDAETVLVTLFSALNSGNPLLSISISSRLFEVVDFRWRKRGRSTR